MWGDRGDTERVRARIDDDDQLGDMSSLIGGWSRRHKEATYRVVLYKWGALVVCTGLLIAAVVGAAVHVDARSKNSSFRRLKATQQLSNTLKPVYHLTAESGWMNDPNGMLYHHGLKHVFFQLNPFAPRWAAPWWGHVVSKDLAHYLRLSPALAPEAWFDKDGVFSGSAMLDDDGVPRLLYTGVTFQTNTSHHYYYQRQAWAAPSDPSDKYLTNWTRPKKTNPLPIDPPPGGDNEQFRDPITPWKVSWSDLQPSMLAEAHANLATIETQLFGSQFQGGEVPPDHPLWLTAVGVQDDCIGAAALYASADLERWQYVGTLFSQLAQNLSRYEGCLLGTAQDVPKGARQFGSGTQCDQFGVDCHMWECPDFFKVTDEVYAFKYSDQVKTRAQFAGDWYVLGDALNYSSAALQDGQDAFQAVVSGEPFEVVATDYGTVYASKSFQAGPRRLWYGWVFEDSLGCDTMCGDGSTFTQQMGWQGMQTLPRQIVYDAQTRRLRFEPIPELQLLRESKLFAGNLSLRGGAYQDPSNALMLNLSSSEAGLPRKAATAQLPAGGKNRNLEILANFTIVCQQSEGCNKLPDNLDMEMGVVIRTGKHDYTVVKLAGSGPAVRGPSGVTALDSLSVYVDKNHSGGATRPGLQGGPVDKPDNGHPLDQPFMLHVFVDGSVVEVYAMNGRGRVTSRIYPLDDESVWDVGIFAFVQNASSMQRLDSVGVRVGATVYDLHSCWVKDL